MDTPKLYMLLLGCKPKGRHTEQHDVFFGIANSLKELIPSIYSFWPEAKEKIHIDAWREVASVNGCKVEVIASSEAVKNELTLFFINLGGYRPNEFDELHYKILLTAEDKAAAIKQAKETAFYKHTCFAGATSHIDDKYGVDIDDFFDIEEILAPLLKRTYQIKIYPANELPEDEIHLGYTPIENLL